MQIDSNLLPAVLDTIIPASPDGRMPAAGSIGLAETVQEAAGEQWGDLAAGIKALDERARESGSEGFAQLEAGERTKILAQSVESHPKLLPSLIFHTYTIYYQNPQVLVALGLEARPPYPVGYELEASDPELLEPVRRRAPFYREAT